MRAILAASLLVLVAGCMGPTVSDVEIELRVVRGSAAQGGCITTFDTSLVCHSIVADLKNLGDTDAKADHFRWAGVSASGGAYDAQDTRGPDSVTPGGNAEVTVMIETPRSDALARLRYTPFEPLAKAVEAPIPPYSSP